MKFAKRSEDSSIEKRPYVIDYRRGNGWIKTKGKDFLSLNLRNSPFIRMISTSSQLLTKKEWLILMESEA
jgi:hypothetical protein